ncbi:MAG: sensor histidine kinase [Janthinobacterium lividum]
MPDDDGDQDDHHNVVALRDAHGATVGKRLPFFIKQNTAAIVTEWERFARTLIPWADGMTPHALRDHIHQILAFIEADMTSQQTSLEQTRKSHGEKKQHEPVTAAQTHAAIRFAGGFDIGQMASEYRALRASVLRLWTDTSPALDAQDITDMIRFNEAIDQELAESVNFYTDQVAHSRELVVAMLSHDLRSPLQGIALATELSLNIGDLSERQTMLARKVLESTDRMGALINDLLDVTRARFGAGLPVVRAMMNMGTVAEQIIDEVRAVHPRRSIELSVSGFLVGEWDKARIGQVFSNLLNNAMQYGSYSAPVHVKLRGDVNAVTVTVGNEGVPIPPDKIRMIFDPLKRLSTDGDVASAVGNLGLGLYITREVVVAHDGTIDVTSSEMEGTTFTARFPRSQPGPALPDARKQA